MNELKQTIYPLNKTPLSIPGEIVESKNHSNRIKNQIKTVKIFEADSKSVAPLKGATKRFGSKKLFNGISRVLVLLIIILQLVVIFRMTN